MNKTVIAGAVVLAAAVPVAAGAVSAGHASAAVQSVRVSRPVTVIVPARSEDDASRWVSIDRGVAHVHVRGVDIRVGPAGPRSYGDYDGRIHAWRLVIIPPAR